MRSLRHLPRRRAAPASFIRAWRSAMTAAGAVALSVVAACGGPPGEGAVGETPQPTTLDRIRAAGVVRVGYANEAPYAYKDSASGRLTGEAPEIARAIMAELGVGEVEGVLTEFGSLIPGLNAGRFDLIAAGMYILPERCRQISFSNPTYAIGEAFIIRAGNPKALHSYEDVREDATARLGVVAGAVQRDYARSAGIPEERIVVFPDAPSAVAGVEAGRVDAYGGTSLTVQDLLDKAASPRLERAEPFRGPEVNGQEVRGYGAFGIRHEDRALREAVNERLAAFIGSPRHLELVRPFGFTEADLPGEATAEALCAGP